MVVSKNCSANAVSPTSVSMTRHSTLCCDVVGYPRTPLGQPFRLQRLGSVMPELVAQVHLQPMCGINAMSCVVRVSPESRQTKEQAPSTDP